MTRAGFALAAALLGAIACAFCYEIAARYLFNAPTEWASPLVSYFLVAAIFLAMPELTRQGAHISINIFLDRAPPALAPYLHRAVSAVAAAACLVAAWFCVDATLGQFNQQIYTSPPFAMPKWAVTACLPYGFLSSGLYFARQLFGRHAAPAQAGESPL